MRFYEHKILFTNFLLHLLRFINYWFIMNIYFKIRHSVQFYNIIMRKWIYYFKFSRILTICENFFLKNPKKINVHIIYVEIRYKFSLMVPPRNILGKKWIPFIPYLKLIIYFVLCIIWRFTILLDTICGPGWKGRHIYGWNLKK
jgi:hypothetical protein